MQLILRCSNGQQLKVNVPSAIVEEFVDGSRARHPPPAIDHVVINHAFGVQNVVPDVDRYRFRLAEGRISLRPHPVCTVSRRFNRYYDTPPEGPNACYSKTIVIVLESPHEDEYLHDVSQPIAPAQGSTGSNIQGYLDCVLRKCSALCDELEAEETRVVLANPIQFQTSLASVIRWSDWHPVRDAVWKDIWNLRAIRNEFGARLASYSPNIIINACTAGQKAQIRTFLADCFSNVRRYEAYHPSNWHWRNRRTLSRCRDQQQHER